MRIRIIANKPRRDDEGDLTELIGKEFTVLDRHEDGVSVNHGPLGYFLYHDEYEVVEQKEAPGAVTP